MTDLTASHDAPISIRSEITTWTAQRNRDAQRHLFTRIVEAQEHSGRTPDEVAHDLGLDVITLASVMRGETDLTMTELRLLSIACEVVVDYRVTPSRADMESHSRSRARDVLRLIQREIGADERWRSNSSTFVETIRWIKE